MKMQLVGSTMAALICGFATVCTPQPAQPQVVRSASDWTDTRGQFIVAHEGGISRFGDKWYWYGTDYSGNPKGIFGPRGRSLANGLRVYSSTDLKKWQYEGVCLTIPESGVGSKGTIHRPSVLFNPATRRYVMWVFAYETLYPDVMLAVAVADRPSGPFRIVGNRETGESHGWAQDLGVFQDDDGKAYLVYDDGLRNIRVDLLTADYEASTKKSVIALTPRHEGAAMFKVQGRYIVAGSGVKGWHNTDTTYAVASHPLGPYSEKGLLSEAGTDTWGSQISNFFAGRNGEAFALCDRWGIDSSGQPTKEHNASSYHFLKLEFHPERNEFSLKPPDRLD